MSLPSRAAGGHLGEIAMQNPFSVYTIHQAKYVDNRLSEVVVLCRDEPEPPVMIYEEQVLPVTHVIDLMNQGDLVYAQWGAKCFPIEFVKLDNGSDSIEVTPNNGGELCNSLAKLPCYDHAF
jgi:hypothetical protein